MICAFVTMKHEHKYNGPIPYGISCRFPALRGDASVNDSRHHAFSCPGRSVILYALTTSSLNVTRVTQYDERVQDRSGVATSATLWRRACVVRRVRGVVKIQERFQRIKKQ